MAYMIVVSAFVQGTVRIQLFWISWEYVARPWVNLSSQSVETLLCMRDETLSYGVMKSVVRHKKVCLCIVWLSHSPSKVMQYIDFILLSCVTILKAFKSYPRNFEVNNCFFARAVKLVFQSILFKYSPKQTSPSNILTFFLLTKISLARSVWCEWEEEENMKRRRKDDGWPLTWWS